MERFDMKHITPAYFRGGDGVIIVYDITCRSSFDRVESWIAEYAMRAHLRTEEGVKVIVGNKTDLEEHRAVSYEEGKSLADAFGVPFFEVSAETGHNIDVLFQELLEKMYRAKKELMPSQIVSHEPDGSNYWHRC